MPDPGSPPPRRQRPFGVVVIAAFLVLDALLSLGERIFDLGTGSRHDLLADPSDQLSLAIAVLVILRLVAAAGLWVGWRRGWVLAMLLVGISLIVNLWLYADGQPPYLRMAIDVVLALYLNQGAVREHFEPTERDAGEPSAASPPTGSPSRGS